MRYYLISVLAFCLVACSSGESDHTWETCPSQTQTQNITGSDDLAGGSHDILIVNLEAGEDPEEVSRALGLDLKPTSSMTKHTGFYEAQVPEGAVPKIEAHLNHLGLKAEIESVEEDHTVSTYALFTKKPNDPLYHHQWNMDMIGLPVSLNQATGRGVTVAILDTGVAYQELKEKNQPAVKDLQSKTIVPGYNTVHDTELVWDGHGHGTHVAGTVAQDTDNSYGVVGVAPNAALMPVKVLSDSGSGSASSVADGIVFAAKHGADIINMSLGSSRYSEINQEAVNVAHEENVTIVAAAGNSGSRTPSYPAAYEHVIAVSAVQMDGKPAPYTQYGPFVDIAAPGGNTKMEGGGVLQETINPQNPSETKFLAWNGTSMASPHVAGVAALLYEWGVTNPEYVEKMLKDGAAPPPEEDLTGEMRVDDKYGAGILNAADSVKSGIFKVRYYTMFLSLLLALFFFYLVRGKDQILSASAKKLGMFVGTALVLTSGLWFLPFVVPTFSSGMAAGVVKFLSMPLIQWDFLVFGIHTPILSSALLPVLTVLLLHGHKTGKYFAAGFSVAVASVLIISAIMAPFALAWIPGAWASVWMVVNAIVCLAISYLSLKGELHVSTPEQNRSE